MKLRLLVFMLVACTGLFAQNKIVTGKVTDATTHTPVAGANITVKGTKTGTVTGNDGQFTIRISSDSKELEVSFVNYISQTIAISDAPLHIELMHSTKGMEEVVVVGYGTQKKKDLTGAVTTIGAKDVGGRQTVQVSEALQGSIGGVTVTRSSSAPGAGSTIRVRGVTTIGTNDPLYIVDGVPVASIDNVNANDVESLTVLKDAASAAIYGSRGAAGVILVTTKRAKDGQSSLEYTYEYGVQKATALPTYVGVQDYMRMINEQAVNDGASSGPYPKDYIDHYLDSNRVNPDKFPNTDWQSTIMTRDLAPRQRHDLVFTTGTGKIKTKASLGYQTAGAFYDNRKYDRYQFRINNDMQISNKIGANLDVFYKHAANKANADELSGGFNPIYEARIMPGIYDAYYNNGDYALGKDGRNAVAKIGEGGFAKYLYNEIGGRMSLNYKPVHGLLFVAMVAPIFDFDKSKNFSAQIKYKDANGNPTSIVNQPNTVLSESRNETFSINGQLLANYARTFGTNHNLDVLAGYEENYGSGESLIAGRTGFTLTGYPYLDAGSTLLRTNGGSAYEYGLHSFFGRLQYNFKGKYFVQGNVRNDQSSRFAPAYRSATFPSVSAGWTISEESFMERIHWLSFLKLRGSWGQAGNERLLDKNGNPDYYPYQAQMNFSTALFYQNGAVVPLSGASQQTYAVNDISWETSETSDIGFDAAFLDSRLNIAFDYYKRKTYDILLALDIPQYLGFDKPNQNAGTLNVKGWELEMGWKDRIGKLTYSIAANLSDSRSQVGDLKGTQILGDQVIRQGSEFNEWYGYLANGLFQTKDDVANSPVISANTKPGDVRYMDLNKDGKITPDDKVLLGGSMPRYTYGGNVRLEYQGFDFGVVVQGVAKQLSKMNSDIVTPFAEAFGNVPTYIVGKYWSTNNTAQQNLNASIPRLSRTSIGNNYALSDFWLMNGAYFRLKNVSVGYTLKAAALKKASIQSLRIYAAANDLFSVSKFPKYVDPEAGSYYYPIVTTFMTGITVKF